MEGKIREIRQRMIKERMTYCIDHLPIGTSNRPKILTTSDIVVAIILVI
jgi:hypothetical protein